MSEELRRNIIRHMRARDGMSPTWWMRAAGLGTCRTLRRELRRMEADGIVRPHPRYGGPNNLVWELCERSRQVGEL